MEFIPNDAELTAEQVLLVTGPNSTYMQVGLIVIYSHLFFSLTVGGKSTYIRAVGAICVMAQIGSYVPCSPVVPPSIYVTMYSRASAPVICKIKAFRHCFTYTVRDKRMDICFSTFPDLR